MSIHPSGDFLAVATEGPVVRLYDINSCQCYVCPYPREHHTGALTSVRFSADARVCATASKDGDVKVSLTVINIVMMSCCGVHSFFLFCRENSKVL